MPTAQGGGDTPRGEQTVASPEGVRSTVAGEQEASPRRGHLGPREDNPVSVGGTRAQGTCTFWAGCYSGQEPSLWEQQPLPLKKDALPPPP